MDPSRPTGTPEARLHFLDYWRIIRIRKAVIILVFLLVSVTATIVTFVLPKTYASNVRIEVHLPSADTGSIDQPATINVTDPFYLQTEYEVIKSGLILDPVIEQLNLNSEWAKKNGRAVNYKTEETRPILKGMISLSTVRNTSLIDITVYDDDANEAARIAQTVAEVYEKHRQEDWQTNLSGGIYSLTKEYNDYEAQRKELESNVDRLRVELKVADIDPQSTTPSSTLSSVAIMMFKQDEMVAKNKATMAEAELNQLTNNNLSHDEFIQALARIQPDAPLTELLQNLNSAEQTLKIKRDSLGDSNIDVIATTDLITKLHQQIDDTASGVMRSIEAMVNEQTNIVARIEQQLAEARETDLATTSNTRPYYEAKSELEDLRQTMRVVDFKLQEDKVTLSMPTRTMVQIIDKAEPQYSPVRPKKTLNVVLGIVVGLVVGFGLAFFIEYLDTSVKTIDDVERTLQSPVLGVIPQNVGYLLEEGAESPHAEAYRVLRTNLLFSRKDDKLNTVAVVSAGAGEGKSTTVCNLATVFAQGGQRVLMVDSDLRRPTLHRLMQVSNNLGLTNYLLKQNTLEEVIQTTKLGTLDFMASGKLPSSSLGILSSAQMRDLITELKRRYDFVFFDSPPIMGVSDASILASEVDMTLQVIQYRRYPQPMNIRAKQLIEKVGGNLIGIVLNNINMAQDESYYYYSGYYHDYYGKNEEEPGPGGNGAAREKSRVDIKPKP
jgi:polysaccharide biosynthesis transport protein